jgi:4-amino-4-deoxy-L-arabinose transferase-like glycosyltransferase
MTSTKIRSAILALLAVAAVAVPLAAPAASQAQWHTIVVGGHVFTHGNFTEGGVSPCTRIEGQLNGWEHAVGDYDEWVHRHDAGEATAKEELANAEGEVVRAQGEAFEYGCDTPTAAAKTGHHGIRPQPSGARSVVNASVR